LTESKHKVDKTIEVIFDEFDYGTCWACMTYYVLYLTSYYITRIQRWSF